MGLKLKAITYTDLAVRLRQEFCVRRVSVQELYETTDIFLKPLDWFGRKLYLEIRPTLKDAF